MDWEDLLGWQVSSLVFVWGESERLIWGDLQMRDESPELGFPPGVTG